jgi:tRNA-2-methylthio-N6-dimethylallyladenosine synthase
MNRGYTREWYIERALRIREILGEGCGISCDMIAGFCSETEEEHQETLSLMDIVVYDFAYMFYYSERPGTLAEKKLKDDVSLEIKKRRLEEIISKQTAHSLERNRKDVGQVYRVLIVGTSKRSNDFLQGRNSANKVIVFPAVSETGETFHKGEYVNVKVESFTRGTLIGKTI